MLKLLKCAWQYSFSITKAPLSSSIRCLSISRKNVLINVEVNSLYLKSISIGTARLYYKWQNSSQQIFFKLLSFRVILQHSAAWDEIFDYRQKRREDNTIKVFWPDFTRFKIVMCLWSRWMINNGILSRLFVWPLILRQTFHLSLPLEHTALVCADWCYPISFSICPLAWLPRSYLTLLLSPIRPCVHPSFSSPVDCQLAFLLVCPNILISEIFCQLVCLFTRWGLLASLAVSVSLSVNSMPISPLVYAVTCLHISAFPLLSARSLAMRLF